MKRVMVLAACLVALRCVALGQFDLEESHTTASLRGVDSLGAGVAWASGAHGTVLRTEDGGYLWQPCSVPPGGKDLDFRGVQGLDANTAVIMASGPGALSKVYKTTDGCQSWKVVFEDPDAEGFFDALRKLPGGGMALLGDPVKGRFALFLSSDRGEHWVGVNDAGLAAEKGEGGFAASNTALLLMNAQVYIGTGGGESARVIHGWLNCRAGACAFKGNAVPMAAGSAGAGVFSLGVKSGDAGNRGSTVLVAVGGNYEKPGSRTGTAAWSRDGGAEWRAAGELPGGYRSAVQYDLRSKAWIAVGPNGVDLSIDDGRDWKAVVGETATGWNAVSLPFVVGEKGRIGKVRAGVLSGVDPLVQSQ